MIHFVNRTHQFYLFAQNNKFLKNPFKLFNKHLMLTFFFLKRELQEEVKQQKRPIFSVLPYINFVYTNFEVKLSIIFAIYRCCPIIWINAEGNNTMII